MGGRHPDSRTCGGTKSARSPTPIERLREAALRDLPLRTARQLARRFSRKVSDLRKLRQQSRSGLGKLTLAIGEAQLTDESDVAEWLQELELVVIRQLDKRIEACTKVAEQYQQLATITKRTQWGPHVIATVRDLVEEEAARVGKKYVAEARIGAECRRMGLLSKTSSEDPFRLADSVRRRLRSSARFPILTDAEAIATLVALGTSEKRELAEGHLLPWANSPGIDRKSVWDRRIARSGSHRTTSRS